jgi:hypothetical protein
MIMMAPKLVKQKKYNYDYDSPEIGKQEMYNYDYDGSEVNKKNSIARHYDFAMPRLIKTNPYLIRSEIANKIAISDWPKKLVKLDH